MTFVDISFSGERKRLRAMNENPDVTWARLKLAELIARLRQLLRDGVRL